MSEDGNIGHMGFEDSDSNPVPYFEYEEKRKALLDAERRFRTGASAEELSVVERLLENLQGDYNTNYVISSPGTVQFSLDDKIGQNRVATRDADFLAIALVNGDDAFIAAAREHFINRKKAWYIHMGGEDTMNPEEAESNMRQWEKAVRMVAMDTLSSTASEQRLQEIPGMGDHFDSHVADPEFLKTLRGTQGQLGALMGELQAEQEAAAKDVANDLKKPNFAAREAIRCEIRNRIQGIRQP